MFVTPAYAQAAGAGGADSLLINFIPIILMVAVFWMFLIRPQQRRAKERTAMLAAISRGDTVVTSGGIVGKVTRAIDNEDLEIEIAQGVKVKVMRGMIAEVRSKPEPVNDNK